MKELYTFHIDNTEIHNLEYLILCKCSEDLCAPDHNDTGTKGSAHPLLHTHVRFVPWKLLTGTLQANSRVGCEGYHGNWGINMKDK